MAILLSIYNGYFLRFGVCCARDCTLHRRHLSVGKCDDPDSPGIKHRTYEEAKHMRRLWWAFGWWRGVSPPTENGTAYACAKLWLSRPSDAHESKAVESFLSLFPELSEAHSEPFQEWKLLCDDTDEVEAFDDTVGLAYDDKVGLNDEVGLDDKVGLDDDTVGLSDDKVGRSDEVFSPFTRNFALRACLKGRRFGAVYLGVLWVFFEDFRVWALERVCEVLRLWY